MKSLFTFLVFCLCLSVATAQTTTRKRTTTTQKPKTTTTPVRKPATTRPRPAAVVPAPTEAAASTLTFPSTEPENTATMDAVKKQQMYDELHGVKNQSTTPDTGKKGRKADRSRDADEMATRADRRNANASTSEANTFIGVRAGGNYATLLDKPVGVTIDPSYGFHVGVVFQLGNRKIAFQPEINFQQDYQKVGTATVSTNSLVVPLLAKFQFGEQGSTRFFVNVGPYGTYSLGSGSTETVIGYGGALGLGVGIPAGSGKFTVEARGYYALGATNTTIEFGNVPGKPILGQLSVGYLFPLGSR